MSPQAFFQNTNETHVIQKITKKVLLTKWKKGRSQPGIRTTDRRVMVHQV